MLHNQNDIQEHLRAHGLKVTHQRMVIYKALMESKNHPSAEEIYDKVKPENPVISLATVYKTLDIFLEHKLLQKVKCEDGSARYEADMSPHDHLFCYESKQIVDFHDAALHDLIEGYLKKNKIENFEIADFQLIINGKLTNPPNSLNTKN